jgi:1-phosphatidylinositol phosphodiesterase
MTGTRLALAALFTGLMAACGGSGAAGAETTYVALMANGDLDTVLTLAALEGDDMADPVVTILGSTTQDYGAMPFLGQGGWVPYDDPDISPACRGSTPLGPTDAAGCVYAPLLADFRPDLERLGIAPEQVTVIQTFAQDEDVEYALADIEDLAIRLDDYVVAQGYQGAPEGATGTKPSYPVAYWHEPGLPMYRTDWMGELPKSLRMSQLSVPGTHDSLARKGGDLAITQTTSITNQLDAGIRAFDIRLRCVDGKLVGYHGSAAQDVNFDQVLTWMRDYLGQHGRESLFVRVKEEGSPKNCGSRTFGDVFAGYYDRWRALFWFYAGTDNPALAWIRGKVVLIQDFTGPKRTDGSHVDYGIPFSPVAVEVHGLLDEDWKVPTIFHQYEKWEKVKRHLGKAHAAWGSAAQANAKTYVNYISGASSGCYPWSVASGKQTHHTNAPQLDTGITATGSVHKWQDFPIEPDKVGRKRVMYQGTNVLTLEWLRANPTPPYVGMIMSDFPGAELIQGIIELNFRVSP